MKNVVKLHNYYCPQELVKAIEQYVHFYNNKRYNESLDNLTPADIYYGRGSVSLKSDNKLKLKQSKKDEKTMNKKSLYKRSETNIFSLKHPSKIQKGLHRKNMTIFIQF